MQRRGFGEAPIHLRGRGLLIAPLLESVPDAHQRLVRDVDHRVRVQRLASWWQQEGSTRLAEHLDRPGDFGRSRIRHLAQRAQRGRAANPPGIGRPVGQRLEDPFAEFPVTLALQLGEGLLRVLIQRVRHRADRVVVRQAQRPHASFPLPAVPRAVERVLQDGELVRVVADVVDEARE